MDIHGYPWIIHGWWGGGRVKASYGNWRRALETVWQDLETGLQDLETGLQDLETGISPRIWKLVRRALETGGLGYFMGFMCVWFGLFYGFYVCVPSFQILGASFQILEAQFPNPGAQFPNPRVQFPNPGVQFPNPGGPVSKSWRPPVSKAHRYRAPPVGAASCKGTVSE